MCEYLFGQCANAPVIMCEDGDCGYVQVEMCEWSGHNVRMNMECASASAVMCKSKCASGLVIMCE